MKITFLLFLLCPLAANAVIVQSSSLTNIDGSNPDALILSANGSSPLASGFASTGRFIGLSDADVADLVDARDFSRLASSFDGFIGSDDFATGVDFLFGIGNVPGAYAFIANSFDPTPFIGASLYTFIGNGAALADSAEFALYFHSERLVADPAPPTPENVVELNLVGGTLLLGTETTFLSTDSNLGTNDTVVRAIQLVPEPSTLLLSAFGALALLRRKR